MRATPFRALATGASCSGTFWGRERKRGQPLQTKNAFFDPVFQFAWEWIAFSSQVTALKAAKLDCHDHVA